MDAPPARRASARCTTRPHKARPSTGMAPRICALPLPQQIADHLGHQIMNGACAPDSRLKEELLAERYQVSRGPVREAFRILERSGLVEIVPRHGARARVFDPADLGSLFSVRAVLLGLAARQATEQARPEMLERVATLVDRLRRSAETMDISAREHATTAGEAQHVIAEFSGNRPLARMLEELTSRALWRMAWCETPLDLNTRVRRQQSARFWSDLLRAMKSGDAAGAERIGRTLLEASRDCMLSAMKAQHRDQASDDHTPASRPARRRASGKSMNGANVPAAEGD
ncbi:GntR family transcriptional regulator [Vineibacter terrae]|uniref:GntR family transcriptional regulator n=1 Tax=Vineibacter terrae TaxID=2586908 RepID=A0A5C8PVM2_9HYPH|nr:GntR family transcriptional regulator [Vineibacter terrae]TXL81920.1 GntR family transcriptional regulator [Vineibacter terrae]